MFNLPTTFTDNRILVMDHIPHVASHDDFAANTDKTHARQKRKRTRHVFEEYTIYNITDRHAHSADDQATLEAAYKRDPKPDKAARLQLVEQVALGEKEVQVRVPFVSQC